MACRSAKIDYWAFSDSESLKTIMCPPRRPTTTSSACKVFAHNSHDFLCVRYEIRQTYAVCLILLFIQRSLLMSC